MASSPAGTKVEKLSFAKVAAAGIKPSSAQQNSNKTDTTKKVDVASPPPDGDKLVSPSNNSNQAVFTPKQKKIVALAPVTTEELDPVDTNGPSVHVQSVQLASPPIKTPRALDGMLMPTNADDAGTQASSSDSVKPPSLDGKSVTSGTTFALDEKESLRPDDSASVMARDDEDSLPAPEPSLPETRAGSDEEMRAFRDQLREISVMEPARQHVHAQVFGHNAHAAPGILYVPPTGPGVGTIPGSVREPSAIDQGVEFPPDPKLLEALDSPKDRIMVLKLEQDIVDFVKDAKESSLKLPQTNTFYRMLAHKLADYYMLGHIVDESTQSVRIYKTPNCRLPPPLTGIATPSTAASTPPPAGPQMKILRRGVDNAGPTIANGSNVTSKTTSENGESGNEDDKRGKLVTREEREARYEAARKRILGSAKPSDSPEEPVEADNSRSSSATGRKNNRKKQRADSDDDFEARSAYSAYYAVPQTTPGAPAPSPYGYPNGMHSQGSQFSPAHYPSPMMATGYQQYGGPPANPWTNQACYPQQGPPNWMPQQQPGYDISSDFQRAMSFQPSPMPAQHPNMQSGYGAQYNQQMAPPQQPWLPPNPYAAGHPGQLVQPYVQNYPARTPPVPNQAPDTQPYQYGQLPSQAFPGRPPSKLEHPLPGSYKSKHFNPQSQSFIPNHMNGPSPMPFQPHAGSMNNPYSSGSYEMPVTPQRQNSVPTQGAIYGQPQPQPHASSGVPSTRTPSQPMTHPLPQPVFPQQPSPAVPLPPKPDTTPPKPADKNTNGPAIVSSVTSSHTQSSILKWATPASLPAKPPPTTGGIPMTGHIAQPSRG